MWPSFAATRGSECCGVARHGWCDWRHSLSVCSCPTCDCRRVETPARIYIHNDGRDAANDARSVAWRVRCQRQERPPLEREVALARLAPVGVWVANGKPLFVQRLQLWEVGGDPLAVPQCTGLVARPNTVGRGSAGTGGVSTRHKTESTSHRREQ